MSFFQDGPVLSNLYEQDSCLKREFSKRIPKALAADCESRLQALGRDAVNIYSALQDESDKNPPKIRHFDAWGRRVDEIEEARHWRYFREMALKWNIVGSGHDQNLGPHARVVQTASMMLFSPTTANYLCPLAMSDAAACVLKSIAPQSMQRRLYDRLISQDSAQAITSGQWMTERPGGSDVSRSETLAVFDKEENGEARYLLSGVKWFTSSITSEMSLLLARVQASDSKRSIAFLLGAA